VAFEADSGAGGTIKIWKRYVWGLGTDDLIAVRDSSSGTAVHYYAVKDKLGSVRGLVKRDGTWQYSKRFGPYGAEVEASGTDVGLRYRWTGREYDAETGFYYFRARYYEPAARRFISEDPIGYAGSPNLYAYVDGKVLDGRDPTGLIVDYSLLATPAPDEVFARPWIDYGPDGIYSPKSHSFHPDPYITGREASWDQILATTEIIATRNGKTWNFSVTSGDVILQHPDRLHDVIGFLINSPEDPNNKGYFLEQGGWCTVSYCTNNVGTVSDVNRGPRPVGAIYGWHTHPNVNMPVIGGKPGQVYAPWPSGVKPGDPDINDLTNSRGVSDPLYVIASNTTIWSYGHRGGSRYCFRTVLPQSRSC
jgi:RHS repeat-associated protein